MVLPKLAAGHDRSYLRALQELRRMYPTEVHNVGGDCLNPKCDYEFTEVDLQEMAMTSGMFTCRQCWETYDYLDERSFESGGGTRSVVLTMKQMGDIGENIVNRLGNVPNVGTVVEWFADYHSPVDFIIGSYGVEVKTLHSESSPRFKMTGGGGRSRQKAIQAAELFCQQHGVAPAMIGVRLNFYNDVADLWFRQGFHDTWIGSANLQHIANVNFADLNAFPNPADVPPPSELPNDDSDIPF